MQYSDFYQSPINAAVSEYIYFEAIVFNEKRIQSLDSAEYSSYFCAYVSHSEKKNTLQIAAIKENH